MLATEDKIAAEHPNWPAFLVFALHQRALYDVTRQEWRRQSPLIDVQALEDTYGVGP